MNETKEEWLTVAEVASRLGLHVRQARRYADKLRGTKDRTSEDVSPTCVLLSAIQSQIAMGGAKGREEGQRTGQGQDKNAEGQGQGQVLSFAMERELRAQIEQQRGEINFLRDALTREQENTRGALARLEEAEKRGQVLIAAAAQGRLTGAGQVESEPADVGQREEKMQTEKGKRSFWRRLFGGG